MAWSDVCKIEARKQIDHLIQQEKLSKNEAIRRLSVESNMSIRTVERLVWPDKSPNAKIGVTQIKNPLSENEPSATSDFHTLMGDSGKKKIVFGLCKTPNKPSLVIQEFKVWKNGKETATRNRFTMSVSLISELRLVLDKVEAMIEERCSEQPNTDGSDHEGDDQKEPPADGSVSTNNVADVLSGEADPAPALDYGSDEPDASSESELIRCEDCIHLTPDPIPPHRKPYCKLNDKSGSGSIFKDLHGAHPCKNFGGRDQQPG